MLLYVAEIYSELVFYITNVVIFSCNESGDLKQNLKITVYNTYYISQIYTFSFSITFNTLRYPMVVAKRKILKQTNE